MPRVIRVFRPPPEYTGIRDLFRYADGKWIPDDGEKDLAFVCKAVPPGSTSGNWFPFAFYWRLQHNAIEAPFWVTEPEYEHNDFYDYHPNSIAENSAMKFCCDKYHVANGHAVNDRRSRRR